MSACRTLWEGDELLRIRRDGSQQKVACLSEKIERDGSDYVSRGWYFWPYPDRFCALEGTVTRPVESKDQAIALAERWAEHFPFPNA